MIDALLYTIYALLAVLVALVVWSLVHQHIMHND